MREKEFMPLIKERLGIENLNEIQTKMLSQASENRDIILLSPTGTGKTLAFILPTLKLLKAPTGRVQAIVIAPSRELVLQIDSIVRSIAKGFKVTVLYGGHKVEDETNSLQATPDIIITTPGRLLDHIKRRNIDVLPTRILVLDEFDKSLELGFEDDMRRIIDRLKNLSRIILTSATPAATLPAFLRLNNPVTLDYLDKSSDVKERMRIHRVDSDGNDKLETLLALLNNLSEVTKRHEKTIIFANYRESAERIGQFLKKSGIPVVVYHGALEQTDREKALAMFNNGSRPVLVATDLAARGLDIGGVENIIHYHQANSPEAYTHRNGRTARVDRQGDIYVLIGPKEDIKDFTEFDDTRYLNNELPVIPGSEFETLYISAGKKEKLSKGDILGFLTKEIGLSGEDISKIDVYDHYSLVALKSTVCGEIEGKVKGKKIKGEKRLMRIISM